MQVECNLQIQCVKKHKCTTYLGWQEFVQYLENNLKHLILSQIYPFVSTFKHNGVSSILNEEKPLWNRIEPCIFFDEAKCGPLNMLYCIIYFFTHGFQQYLTTYILYKILQKNGLK